MISREEKGEVKINASKENDENKENKENNPNLLNTTNNKSNNNSICPISTQNLKKNALCFTRNMNKTTPSITKLPYSVLSNRVELKVGKGEEINIKIIKDNLINPKLIKLKKEKSEECKEKVIEKGGNKEEEEEILERIKEKYEYNDYCNYETDDEESSDSQTSNPEKLEKQRHERDGRDGTLDESFSNKNIYYKERLLLSYSQSTSSNINSNSNTYSSLSKTKTTKYKKSSLRKYDLEERKTPFCLISKTKMTHKLLPLRLKNNSKYKKRLFSFFRRNKPQKYKTDSCRHFNYLKNSFLCQGNMKRLKDLKKEEDGKEESNKNSFMHFSPTLTKLGESVQKEFIRKKCLTSVSKFSTKNDSKLKEHVLFDYITNQPVVFYLHYDDEIGFNEHWQSQLKQTEMDDDIMTDNEQLQAAGRHIRKEVRESGFIVKETVKKIRNTTRWRNLVQESELPKLVFKETKKY